MNKKIYKVTQTQLSSLQSNGFITVDGVRYDYDPNSLYILADPFSPEYRLETQGHNLHLLKDNVIISDLTVPFAQASVYASNAKNLQNKTGSKAYTYYDILPRVDYKDFLLIKDLPMEGILCGIVRNGYFYKVREEGSNTDIPFTLFCQTVDGYYSLSTSEITTPIEGYTILNYFNQAKFIPYGSVKKINNTEPDSNGNVNVSFPGACDWEFLDLIAEKTFSKAFTEVKPGKSGIPSGNATVDVTTTTWQKKINGAIVGYKTIVDVTCRCPKFNLNDIGLNVLLSKVGSRWFFPRMAVSRGNIQSGKFTKMMDRLNSQKDRVGILVDEVSVFRDATTNLGYLNTNGVTTGQVVYDYAEFRVFAVMLELDKNHEGESIPCTGAHYRIVLYHPETIL